MTCIDTKKVSKTERIVSQEYLQSIFFFFGYWGEKKAETLHSLIKI